MNEPRSATKLATRRRRNNNDRKGVQIWLVVLDDIADACAANLVRFLSAGRVTFAPGRPLDHRYRSVPDLLSTQDVRPAPLRVIDPRAQRSRLVPLAATARPVNWRPSASRTDDRPREHAGAIRQNRPETDRNTRPTLASVNRVSWSKNGPAHRSNRPSDIKRRRSPRSDRVEALAREIRSGFHNTPSEMALQVAVGVEPERLEPGPLRLLRRTPEQLTKIV
jgi:hypothetical protein